MAAHGSLVDFVAADETAAQLLRRTCVDPFFSGVPFVDRHVPLRPGSAVEIAGPPGSGKTELLLQMAVSCILPKTFNGISFGGQEGVAVFMDLDGRFDAMRLVQVLDRRLAVALGTHQQDSLSQQL
eukprot:evm.model.scf_5.19 EVM.evm.TU.scf_5.19   scf_5:236710-238649(+)